jgi:hypothetical protein
LLKILYYCPISPCIQHFVPAALLGSIARKARQEPLQKYWKINKILPCKSVSFLRAFPATQVKTQVIFSLVKMLFFQIEFNGKRVLLLYFAADLMDRKTDPDLRQYNFFYVVLQIIPYYTGIKGVLHQ